MSPERSGAAVTGWRPAVPVWGEGFVDDSLADIARVDRWDLVHPDEVLRFFPGLVATAGNAAVLLDLLEQAVAVRWWRIGARGGHRPVLQSVRAEALARIGDTHEAAWFPSPGPLRSALDRLRGAQPESAGAGEAAAVLTLDALLAQRRAGRMLPYTDHLALTLAFQAGIHPAYLWSEALPLHESATAIGWLGVLARGRRALLPRDIAATLAGSIAEDEGASGRLRDQRFGLCGLTPAQWGLIGRAARRCLEGRRDIVRLKPTMHPARLPPIMAGATHRLRFGGIAAARTRRRAS